MTGLLNLVKPPGMTSHDVVGYVRRVLGQKRVGHTGTLDPGAAGVLVVAVGKATRVIEFLTDHAKEYVGELTFGCSTSTQDGEGAVTQRGGEPPTEEQLRATLRALVGQLEQVPPMVSAVKHKGKPLHVYARRGEEVRRPARTITLTRFDLLEYSLALPARARFAVACSKGTYVRTLCDEIGSRLGVPAHLSFLVRTAAGPFRLAGSRTLEELAAAHETGRAAELLLPLDTALGSLPAVVLEASAAQRVSHGSAVPATVRPSGGEAAAVECCARDEQGALLAIGRWDPCTDLFSPRKVLVTEEHDES